MRLKIMLTICLLLAACSTTQSLETEQMPSNAQTATSTTTPSTPTEVAPTQTPTEEPMPTTAPTTAPPTATLIATMTPDEEPQFLDFSAIEGEWSGEGREKNGTPFLIEVNLRSGAKPGWPVGEISYKIGGTNAFDCNGTWSAESALDPLYEVWEAIDGCPNGTVFLEHDPETGTLHYEFTPADPNPNLEATGTLTRSD